MRASESLRSTGVVLLSLLLTFPYPLAPATIVVEAGCSLPDAITAANTDAATGGCPAGAGDDVVKLTADVTLTTVDNVASGPNGLPVVSSTLTVDGQGYSIARDAAAPDFRVLHVGGSGDLVLRNANLDNGSLVGYSDNGSGILNFGKLKLESSSISGSRTKADGGGIFTADDTSLTLVNSTLSGNHAEKFGGGIYSGFGASTALSDSVLAENYGGFDGGGIFSYQGGIVIHGSTISGNTTPLRGGGVFVLYGYDDLTITDSLISNNEAGSTGGGVYSGAGTATLLLNVTLSGNSAGFRGGGLYHSFYVAAELFQTTLSGNSSPTGANIFGDGGGLTLTGTIIGDPVTGTNCGGIGIFDGGGSLDDDGSCPGPGAGGLTGLDPVLADNGGPTLTHALQAGSSAIDHAGACGLLVDQRGFGRDALCDSGAFEFDGALPVGASVGGLDSHQARCINQTAGGSATILGQPSWNCRSAGLAIDGGDRVHQEVRGTSIGVDFTGEIEGIDNARVSCRNQTTGQEVRFALGGDTSWNCGQRGLSFSPTDSISWFVRGVAQ